MWFAPNVCIPDAVLYIVLYNNAIRLKMVLSVFQDFGCCRKIILFLSATNIAFAYAILRLVELRVINFQIHHIIVLFFNSVATF
jgi:hypothetical protein